MTGDPSEASRIFEITPDLWVQLQGVAPSRDRDFEYRPCRVRLRTGEWRDRVYVVEAMPYIRYWGVWPWEDRGKHYVALEDVADIEESPTRMPRNLASRLYAAGESGMGYFIFKIVLADGRQVACLTGGAVEWVDLPAGIAAEDIAAVIPHGGREEEARGEISRGAAYAWCLYRRTED